MMGTDYYYSSKPCECCGRQDKEIQIGNSTSGYVFTLLIYPNKGINNLDNWKSLLSQEGVVIFDENNNEISFDYLINEITNRSHSLGLLHDISRGFVGYGEGTYDYFDNSL